MSNRDIPNEETGEEQQNNADSPITSFMSLNTGAVSEEYMHAPLDTNKEEETQKPICDAASMEGDINAAHSITEQIDIDIQYQKWSTSGQLGAGPKYQTSTHDQSVNGVDFIERGVNTATVQKTDNGTQHQLWKKQGARPKTGTNERETQMQVNAVDSNEKDISTAAVAQSTVGNDMQLQLFRAQGARPKTSTCGREMQIPENSGASNESSASPQTLKSMNEEHTVESGRDLSLSSALYSSEVVISTLEESCQNMASCTFPSPATPRTMCRHGYAHRCSLKFPCCGELYHCHHCHNEAETKCRLTVRSSEATDVICAQCNKKQKITCMSSQSCKRCGTELAEYFCPLCKLFSGSEKKPFHCPKCGCCRIRGDRAFHCDSCEKCVDSCHEQKQIEHKIPGQRMCKECFKLNQVQLHAPAPDDESLDPHPFPPHSLQHSLARQSKDTPGHYSPYVSLGNGPCNNVPVENFDLTLSETERQVQEDTLSTSQDDVNNTSQFRLSLSVAGMHDTSIESRVAEASAVVERFFREPRQAREQERREREERMREEREQTLRDQEEREREEEERAARGRQDGHPGVGEDEGATADTSNQVPGSNGQRHHVQESPSWLCEHYRRRCKVKFACCNDYHPCHYCHNRSEHCPNEEAKANEATHLQCIVCREEQPVTDSYDTQTCQSCGTKLSEYFCPTCKHFCGVEKKLYHCDKCGICQAYKDWNFHCEVCNVCLDKRLQGNHRCRPNSGRDECCICLEDAVSGCQILPCSHTVHRECAALMRQNRVRTCPVCRAPLNG